MKFQNEFDNERVAEKLIKKPSKIGQQGQINFAIFDYSGQIFNPNPVLKYRYLNFKIGKNQHCH